MLTKFLETLHGGMMHFITNSTNDLSKEEDVQRFEYTGSCPVKCMIHHINGVTV